MLAEQGATVEVTNGLACNKMWPNDQPPVAPLRRIRRGPLIIRSREDAHSAAAHAPRQTLCLYLSGSCGAESQGGIVPNTAASNLTGHLPITFPIASSLSPWATSSRPSKSSIWFDGDEENARCSTSPPHLSEQDVGGFFSCYFEAGWDGLRLGLEEMR